MPVDVQGAGQFRRGLQPVAGTGARPIFSGRHRDSGRPACARRQRTSGTRSSPNSLPNSPGGRYWNCSTALMRHVPPCGPTGRSPTRACCSSRATQQGQSWRCREQAILGQETGKRRARNAEGDVGGRARAWSGAPSRRPNAARTAGPAGCTPCPISAAASSTARVDLSVAMGGWRAAALSGAVAPGSSGPGSVSRPCWNALRSVSSLRPRCSATSLRLQPAPSNCCAWAVTSGVITVAPRVARGV